MVSEDQKYGKWSLGFEEKDMILQTSIRLPDLSKFTGIMISISSTNILEIKMVLVEESIEAEQNWEVLVTGIISEFQKIKIPFRYFYLKDRPDAIIDLGKIGKIRFIVNPEFTVSDTKEGWFGIDKVLFYK